MAGIRWGAPLKRAENSTGVRGTLLPETLPETLGVCLHQFHIKADFLLPEERFDPPAFLPEMRGISVRIQLVLLAECVCSLRRAQLGVRRTQSAAQELRWRILE